MKVNISEEKKNPFLKRKELTVDIDHESEASPSKAAVQQYLAKELKTEAEKIEIKSIFTDAGMPRSKARVFAWEEAPAKKEAPKPAEGQ
jgi:ribosomal protein S24E